MPHAAIKTTQDPFFFLFLKGFYLCSVQTLQQLTQCILHPGLIIISRSSPLIIYISQHRREIIPLYHQTVRPFEAKWSLKIQLMDENSAFFFFYRSVSHSWHESLQLKGVGGEGQQNARTRFLSSRSIKRGEKGLKCSPQTPSGIPTLIKLSKYFNRNEEKAAKVRPPRWEPVAKATVTRIRPWERSTFRGDSPALKGSSSLWSP